MQLATWNPWFTPLFRQDNLLSPAVNISETETQFAVEIELPGVAKDDVDISVNDGVLTITGQKKLQDEQNYHRVEIAYGEFSRSFTLPKGADEANIGASYADGLLQVTIPKAETQKPKQITIN